MSWLDYPTLPASRQGHPDWMVQVTIFQSEIDHPPDDVIHCFLPTALPSTAQAPLLICQGIQQKRHRLW